MAMNISLNGSNFVSDRTRNAFEQALHSTGIQKQESPHSAARSPQPALSPQPSALSPHSSALTPHSSLSPQSSVLSPQSSVLSPQSSVLSPQSLATLDHALAQSYEHQTLAMRVHEQYLANQSDYARLFGQLMQQQGTIFAQAAAAPQQAEITATVLETLSRSMARFHDLQEQTLDVHKQFLAQQSDYAQATIQLLAGESERVGEGERGSEGARRSSELVEQQGNKPTEPWIDATAKPPVSAPAKRGNGDGNGNGHHPHETPNEAVDQRSTPQPSAFSLQPSALSPQPSALSPQPSALSPQSSVLSPQSSVLVPALLAIVSDKTGYPADMLELDMDMEADLGIDSIKRVEILGALQDAHPDLPEIPTDVLTELRTLRQIVDKMQAAEQPSVLSPQSSVLSPQPSALSPQPSALTPALLAIVSDKTGYPADMLELDMDMEADLGIDSIKRVEILGALQDAHPDLPEIPTDVLTELRTLRQIVDKMQGAEQRGGESVDQRISESAEQRGTPQSSVLSPQSSVPNPQSSKKA